MHSFYFCRHIILYFVIVLFNSITRSSGDGNIEIPEDVALGLYASYKDAVASEKASISLRRIFSNREFEIHVKKLKAVNGYKKHNLKIEESDRNNPVIYIDNPVETKLPKAYLTYQDFKKELTERVLRLREEFANPQLVEASFKYNKITVKNNKEKNIESRILTLPLNASTKIKDTILNNSKDIISSITPKVVIQNIKVTPVVVNKPSENSSIVLIFGNATTTKVDVQIKLNESTSTTPTKESTVTEVKTVPDGGNITEVDAITADMLTDPDIATAIDLIPASDVTENMVRKTDIDTENLTSKSTTEPVKEITKIILERIETETTSENTLEPITASFTEPITDSITETPEILRTRLSRPLVFMGGDPPDI